MRRAAWLLTALCGCGTVTPMQTASVVDRGWLRVGGQLSTSGWCGELAKGVTGASQCTEYPDGIPMPELRLNARYGIARGADVGASLQALVFVEAPERTLQLGATVDAKGELLRIATSGPTHVLSVALLGGGAVAGRFGLPPWTQVEWAVPFFYGLQLRHWELVLGFTASQRFTKGPGVAPSSDTVRTGFTVGLFHREPAGFALQLGYLTDPARFASGTLQLQVGMFFDLSPARLVAARAP